MSIRTANSCNNCRRWVLRTFITSIGGPALQIQRRAFTSSLTPQETNEGSDSPQATSNTNITSDIPSSAFLKPTEEDAESSSIISQLQQSSSSSIPWYLQNQPAVTEQSQSKISSRQKLPDLPEHSPQLLQPLLEHISTNLGLDDLSVLDLRPMDPPPALGANLLMIIGTTRSEKHLHVSADRLCRWLRTEHGLSPYADGLLGRNELKLKMRRLTKKKKLLSAVGANTYDDDADLDDGIRTGWVCVNIGTVEGGELPKTPEQIEREANIVGFNTSVAGSKIVVQMMTEERREALNLEKLWTGILRRNIKAKNGILGLEEVEEEEEQVPVVYNAPKREKKVHKAPAMEEETAEPFLEHTQTENVLSSENSTPSQGGEQGTVKPKASYVPFQPAKELPTKRNQRYERV